MFYELPEIRNELRSVVQYTGAFTDEEVQKIHDYIELTSFKSGGLRKGILGDNGNQDNEYRDSNVFWVEITAEIHWMFDRFGHLINKINRDFWNYELTGFHPLQYTEYEAGGQYNWHQDSSGDTRQVNRKLSFTMMLSNENEFSGGKFQLCDDGPERIKTISPKRGDILFFPSHLSHRITPIEEGKRKSLVGWVMGPRGV